MLVIQTDAAIRESLDRENMELDFGTLGVMEKSQVKAHVRRIKGKLVNVRTYTNKQHKQVGYVLPSVSIQPFRAGTKSQHILEMLLAGKHTKQEILDSLVSTFGGTVDSNKNSFNLFLSDFQKPQGTYSASRGVAIDTDVAGQLSIGDVVTGSAPPKKTGGTAPQKKQFVPPDLTGYSLRKRWEIWAKVDELKAMDKASVFAELLRLRPIMDTSHIRAKAYAELLCLEAQFTKDELTKYYFGKKKPGMYVEDLQKPADRQAPNYSEVQKIFADFPALATDIAHLKSPAAHGINTHKKVWSRHSSPFVFDKINIYDNLSRGEGFQAFGVGLYSETNDGVYSTYQSSFKNRAPILVDGEPITIDSAVKTIMDQHGGDLVGYIDKLTKAASRKLPREEVKAKLLPMGYIAAYTTGGNDLQFRKPSSPILVKMIGAATGNASTKFRVHNGVTSGRGSGYISNILEYNKLNPGTLDQDTVDALDYLRIHTHTSTLYSIDEALDEVKIYQEQIDKVKMPKDIVLQYHNNKAKNWSFPDKGTYRSGMYSYMPTLEPKVVTEIQLVYDENSDRVYPKLNFGQLLDDENLIYSPASTKKIRAYLEAKNVELRGVALNTITPLSDNQMDAFCEQFVKDLHTDIAQNLMPSLQTIKNKTASVETAQEMTDRLTKQLGPAVAEAQKILGKYGNLPKTAVTYEFKTANRDMYLDYDKPLDQQHPYIKERLLLLKDKFNTHAAANNGYVSSNDLLLDTDTGSQLYNKLGRMLEKYAKPSSKVNANIGQEVASKLLDTMGVVGNKFIDGYSRNGTVNPSYNYVTYGDRNIQIITRKSMDEPMLLIKSDSHDTNTWAALEPCDFQGLKCMIENKRGTVRTGVDVNGEKWKTKMFHHYGYIRGTEGTDGDEVDCYIGPDPHASMVHIVHQLCPETKQYDEDKVMLGFDSQEHARDAFLAHYHTHEFLGKMTSLPMHEFRELLKKKGSKGIKLTKSHIMYCIHSLEKALNTGRLVKKIITDKNGKREVKWVDPNKKKPQAKNPKAKTSAPDSSSVTQSSSGKGKTPGADSKSTKKEERNFKEVPEAEAMEQASWTEISAQMHKNLSEISRGELVHKPIEGTVTAANSGKIADTMRDEISKYVSYLAGDTTDLLHRLTNLVEKTIGDEAFKGVAAQDMQLLGMDIVRKLVHQEAESNRQTFTDHGIRHIVGNILYQHEMLEVLDGQGIETTPNERLMSIFVQVNHDVGYTVPFVREGGQFGLDATKLHPQFSEKIASEQKSLWNEDKVFNAQEYDRALSIIRQHSKSSLDVSDPIMLTTQIADNTSLFSKEKLPPVFHKVPEGRELLTQMGVAAKEKNIPKFEELRESMYSAIDKCAFAANLKRDLKASIANMNYLTPKFTLGILAGEIHKVGKSADAMIEVRVKYNEFDSFLQTFMDMGQTQTKKLLGDYGVTDFTQTEYKLGEHEGKAVFKIVVDGYKSEDKEA